MLTLNQHFNNKKQFTITVYKKATKRPSTTYIHYSTTLSNNQPSSSSSSSYSTFPYTAHTTSTTPSCATVTNARTPAGQQPTLD